jgi:putative ABC transport system ATP-binding protein
VTNTIAARTEQAVKVYGEGDTAVHALRGIDVEFATGQFTAIMGPSGSGKSTLMHCMAGLDKLTSGRTYIGDEELGSLTDKELTRLRRENVGFVFQAYNLIPTLNASENIRLPLSISGADVDDGWVNQLIEILGLEDRLHHLPSELSGGQQQRVAAARALASRPQIIFADEPSGNLDSRSGAELLGLLRRAVDEFDQTIVMVTHEPFAAAFADRIVFLADGQVTDEMLDPTQDSVFDHLRTMEH